MILYTEQVERASRAQRRAWVTLLVTLAGVAFIISRVSGAWENGILFGWLAGFGLTLALTVPALMMVLQFGWPVLTWRYRIEVSEERLRLLAFLQHKDIVMGQMQSVTELPQGRAPAIAGTLPFHVSATVGSGLQLNLQDGGALFISTRNPCELAGVLNRLIASRPHSAAAQL